MKKLIVCVLSCILVFSAVNVYAETPAEINVIFDRVRLVVNGGMTDVPTMVYNGRTYIQLKAVSEIFGAELLWDGETNTAFLTTMKEEEPEEPKIEPEPEVKSALKEVRLKNGEYTVGKVIKEGRYTVSGEGIEIIVYYDHSDSAFYRFYDSDTIILDLKTGQRFEIKMYQRDIYGRFEVNGEALFTPVVDRELTDKLITGNWVVGKDIEEGRYVIASILTKKSDYASDVSLAFLNNDEQDNYLRKSINHSAYRGSTITLDLKSGQEFKLDVDGTAGFTPVTEREFSNELGCGNWVVGLDIKEGKYCVNLGSIHKFYVFDKLKQEDPIFSSDRSYNIYTSPAVYDGKLYINLYNDQEIYINSSYPIFFKYESEPTEYR